MTFTKRQLLFTALSFLLVITTLSFQARAQHNRAADVMSTVQVLRGSVSVATYSPGHSPCRVQQIFGRGYYFRMLKGQGRRAPSGARVYLVDGKMTGGFAIVAYPAEYGNSGVMTIIINEDGLLLQKDLGKTTTEMATAMTEFNPDDTWSPVEE